MDEMASFGGRLQAYQRLQDKFKEAETLDDVKTVIEGLLDTLVKEKEWDDKSHHDMW